MVASSCARSILNMEAVSSSRNFREFVQDYTAQIKNDYTASHNRTSHFHKKCRVNLKRHNISLLARMQGHFYH